MADVTDIIGAAEAARVAEVSVETIKRAARNGQLPSTAKLDGATGAWLFDLADVQEWAARRAAVNA